jgi:predicted house-cleaning noncanonical NTP pyrophosphatase (MazG superfamily)
MAERVYNKLVRDRIPEIIRSQGETPITRRLTPEQLRACLTDKLQEEVAEYLADPCLMELCDILEVTEALIRAHGYPLEHARAQQAQKAQRNGGFTEGVYLEKVIERP